MKMLPNFIKVQAQFSDALDLYYQKSRLEDPFLSKFRKKIVVGNKLATYPKGAFEGKELEDINLKQLSQIENDPFQPDVGSIMEYGHLYWIDFIQKKITIDLLKKARLKVVDDLKAATEMTGNEMKVKKDPPDFYLELLEQKLEFTRSGKPAPGQIVWPDGSCIDLEILMAGYITDPKFKESYDKIVEGKRKEWVNRESNRKLVD